MRTILTARRSLRLVLALLAVVAAVLVGSGPASAATGEYHLATKYSGGWPIAPHACLPLSGFSYDGGARGCFQAYGDRIFVMDVQQDGRSAGVLFWAGKAGSDYYRTGVCRQAAGQSESLYVCDLDFKESQPITIVMATCNATSTVNCHSQSQYPDTTRSAPYHTST